MPVKKFDLCSNSVSWNAATMLMKTTETSMPRETFLVVDSKMNIYRSAPAGLLALKTPSIDPDDDNIVN